MEELKRCVPCGGSGEVLGGGMMKSDCHYCHGKGKIKVVDEEIDYLAMKQTDGYRNAKSRLMSSHSDISEQEAEKLLDEAFENERPKPRKRKSASATATP